MAGSYQTPQRMALKRKAIPLPDMAGRSVLDVGCDHGHWCWLAADLGAARVLGLDRNRDGINLIAQNLSEAKSRGVSDICDFAQVNIGKQWREFGKFDVVLLFSAYHHLFENCKDHLAIWFWLWRHTGGELLWENPTGTDDAVVRINVSYVYEREAILSAARHYFEVEYIGPALHEKTREVWRCKPRNLPATYWCGKLTSGGGGASRAFVHADGRRIGETYYILGYEPFPGTLNAKLHAAFDWGGNYYRAQILETPDRANLAVEWNPRWVRFYPVTVNDIEAHAIRFEGESYSPNYIEFIARERFRDSVGETIDVRS